MIILDTCVLRSVGLNSTALDILAALRVTLGERVAAPSIVIEELAAQQAVAYREKYVKAEAAFDGLTAATPWRLHAVLPPLELDRFREHWRGRYSRVVSELAVDEKVMREALFREMNVIAPCRLHKDQKVGARDAAIWLTAAKTAHSLPPEERVFFVSSNTRDFGTAEQRDDALTADITDLGSRFVHMTSLDEVVTEFTKPVVVEPSEFQRVLSDGLFPRLAPDEAELPDDVDNDAVRVLLENFERGVTITGEDGLRHRADYVAMTAEPPWDHFLSYEDAAAHQIGDDVWCTATVHYLLCGLFETEHDLVVGAVRWSVRVAVSLTDKRPKLPTVLRTVSLTAAEPEDLAAMPVGIFSYMTHERQLVYKQWAGNPIRFFQSPMSRAETAVLRHLRSRLGYDPPSPPPLND